MKLIPKIPLALLLLGTTLPVCAQNNPPVQCPCCTDVCYVVQGPTGSYTYTNVEISPGTNVCLGTTIAASPIALQTCSTVIGRGHWEAAADCWPDTYFTNFPCPFFITNWWVASGPGYSASGEYNGWAINPNPPNCGWVTITFYGTWRNQDPCTTLPIAGGTISISTNFYVANVQIFEPWKAVCTNGSTSFTLTNTCGTVTWEVSPIIPGGPYAQGSTIFAGTNCGTYTVTARSTVNTNCTGSTTLYVVELDSISVDAATYVSSNNWAAVKTTNATDYVTLTANLCPFVTNAAVLFNWSGGGETVPDNPLQRRVHKNASVKTTVSASCCGNSTNVNIWIIWGTVTVQSSGTTPAHAVQFGTRYDGTEILGGRIYAGGAIGVGKVVPIAQLTPSGVHNVATNGWTFRRERWFHSFDDGRSADITDASWTGDTSDPGFQNLTPDSSDMIYDRDAPNVNQGTANACAEVYAKFHQWIEWNGTQASDGSPGTDTFPAGAEWHWKAKWQATASPQVILTNVGGGYITLPNTAAGCP